MNITMKQMVKEIYDEEISLKKAQEMWNYTTYEECTLEDVKEIYHMVML